MQISRLTVILLNLRTPRNGLKFALSRSAVLGGLYPVRESTFKFQVGCGERQMQHSFQKLLAVLGILFLATVSLFGQAESGTITGIVTDTSGAVVPGATVTVVSAATGLTR